MKDTKRFELDSKQAYKLLAVTDKEGNDKSCANAMYKNAISCVAIDLRYDEGACYDGKYRMHLDFVQNESGEWIRRGIHTSLVEEVTETETSLTIHTRRSIYVMEKAELKDTPLCTDRNTIELYLSLEDYYHFGKGFYWDNEGRSHELEADINVGMFQDTVLIGMTGDSIESGYVCRYYYQSSCIEFYDTLYRQQGYNTPMLIHNTSKENPLIISFEGCNHMWTIQPSESEQILPFCAI